MGTSAPDALPAAADDDADAEPPAADELAADGPAVAAFSDELLIDGEAIVKSSMSSTWWCAANDCADVDGCDADAALLKAITDGVVVGDRSV